MTVNTVDWRAEPGEDGTVERVDKNAVTSSNGWTIGWRAEAGPLPEVGDQFKTLGQIGYPVYGFVVNGELVWYQTPEERQAERDEMLRKMRDDRERRFVESETKLDASYDALPLPFQVRIDQLRNAGGREWRVDSESYEMFVCEEAVKIARQFQTSDAIEAWYKLGYSEQKAALPDLGEGHSGNTFGSAASLAAKWARTGLSDRAEALVVAPQALAPLAGDPRYASPA